MHHRHIHNNSTEYLPLVAFSAQENIEANSCDQQHTPKSAAFPVLGVKKSLVQRLLGERFTGWRFGALHFAVWATVVFVINLTLTIWSSSRKSGILFDGDCDRVKTLNTWLHLLINVLSTILLSGSNYCMQCVSAPTRSEVDKAHAKGKWLDIGIPSIRNIRHLSRRRILLWCLLSLTSLPLHLFYNSMIYGSSSSNDYFVFNVNKSFLTDSHCRNCTAPANDRWSRYVSDSLSDTSYNLADASTVLQNLHSDFKANKLDRLEPVECLTQYHTTIQSNRRHVLLVAGDKNFSEPIKGVEFINGSNAYSAEAFYAKSARRYHGPYGEPLSWLCPELEGAKSCADYVERIRNNPTQWRAGTDSGPSCRDKNNICKYRGYPVEYCLSQSIQPHCRLQLDNSIAFTITIMTLVKAAIMFFIAYSVQEEPLVTMGDAVASFLGKEDPSTKNMCLHSVNDFKKQKLPLSTQTWLNTSSIWKDAASRKRWVTTLFLCICALATAAYCLNAAIIDLDSDRTPCSFQDLARRGFGTIDSRFTTAILGFDLIPNILLANLPQVIISLIYFSWNALFTSFLLSYEWVSYAHKKKGLRVTRSREAAQRSTYFLQLPHRFAIPLTMLIGTMHWLISQSIFLVAIDLYDINGRLHSHVSNEDPGKIRVCGWSPIAIISAITLGSIMIIGMVGLSFVPYKKGMPLAGSCSMAISAACHLDKRVDPDGEMAAVQKLQWGVVGVNEGGIGHCSFSTGEVELPTKGKLYAGTTI